MTRIEYLKKMRTELGKFLSETYSDDENPKETRILLELKWKIDFAIEDLEALDEPIVQVNTEGE